MRIAFLLCCCLFSVAVFSQNICGLKLRPIMGDSVFQVLVDVKDEAAMRAVDFPPVYEFTEDEGIIWFDSVQYGIVDTVLVAGDTIPEQYILQAYVFGRSSPLHNLIARYLPDKDMVIIETDHSISRMGVYIMAILVFVLGVGSYVVKNLKK